MSVHTQIYQVVMMSILMLAREFKLQTVLDHSEFDAWKLAPLIRDDPNVYTICGPRVLHFDRTERRIVGLAAQWWQHGVRRLGINTDAPVIPQEELSYQAAMGCWYGWKPYEALRGVTQLPAEALKIQTRVGSIQEGLDAEFCLWTGDPIDPRSVCEITVIRGRVVYNAAEGREF